MKSKVFIVIGLAGSGKSSVSKHLARRYGTAYLDKDTLSTGFTGLLLEAHGHPRHDRETNEYYQRVIFPVEYDTVMLACADNVRLGISVVIDAPFSRYLEDADYLVAARARYEWPDCDVFIVHVRASEDTVRRRVHARANERDHWKLGHWDEFWAMMSKQRCEWRGGIHLQFDNDGDEIDSTEFERSVAEAGSS